MSQKKSHYTRIVRRWHGHVGIIATIFLVLLVLTGIVLNHEEALKLDKREISAPWLMNWYGIRGAEVNSGYLLGEHYFSWEGDKWALGDQPLAGSAENPVGAVEIGGVDYVATASAMYLYQADGQLLDKLEKQSLPAYPILALGKIGDRVVLRTPAAILASADGLDWQKIEANGLSWSTPQALPEGVKSQMKIMLAPSLSVERVLLDVHSGRIFGRYGPWAVDIAAIALLMLGLSGLWMYWRSMKQGKARHKQH